MGVNKALKLARNLVDKHLPDMFVEIELTNSKKTLGMATQNRYFPRRGVLSLSKPWMEVLPEEDVVDTILHEIAHLMVGVRQGHNHKWKDACRKIGAKPERLARGLDTSHITYKYDSYCPSCKKVVGHFSRRPKIKYICSACKTEVELRQNY